MSDTTLNGLINALREAAKQSGPHRQLMGRAAAVLEDLGKKLQPKYNAAGQIEFVIESGVSSKNGAPMVQIAAGGMAAQIDPSIARKLAVDLLDCATGAEDEAALMVVGRDIGLDQEDVGRLIMAVRRARDEAKQKRTAKSA